MGGLDPVNFDNPYNIKCMACLNSNPDSTIDQLEVLKVRDWHYLGQLCTHKWSATVASACHCSRHTGHFEGVRELLGEDPVQRRTDLGDSGCCCPSAANSWTSARGPRPSGTGRGLLVS